jgi:hypothetical protein
MMFSATALVSLPVAVTVLATASGGAAAMRPHWGHGTEYFSRVFASGPGLTHSTPGGSEALSNPDDITALGSRVFVAFQNGVGPQGEASTSGNLDSTIVEFNSRGTAIRQWDILGKCDGLTADPRTGRLIATVNEDANSSLYVLKPSKAATPVHYSYNEALPSNGGTDAISFYHGMILVSASAPGTTGAAAPQATYPAVYRVSLKAATHIATVAPLFFDEAPARLANTNSPEFGSTVQLALTDPDSNEVVPSFASRFGGEFMLTSQGDQQQIFVRRAGTVHQSLSVLSLSTSVDDTAWPSSRSGALYITDNGANTIYTVTGRFRKGQTFVAATPCDSNSAPGICPAPGYPSNYLGTLNPNTGQITPVALTGPAVAAQGMLFLPR